MFSIKLQTSKDQRLDGQPPVKFDHSRPALLLSGTVLQKRGRKDLCCLRTGGFVIIERIRALQNENCRRVGRRRVLYDSLSPVLLSSGVRRAVDEDLNRLRQFTRRALGKWQALYRKGDCSRFYNIRSPTTCSDTLSLLIPIPLIISYPFHSLVDFPS